MTRGRTPWPLSRTVSMAVVALLALPLGCDEAGLMSSSLQCRVDRQCDPGLVCSFNHCILPGRNTLSLGARISPRSDTGLVPQQVPRIELSGGPDIAVTLVTPVRLRGTARPAENPFVLNVPGEVELRADGDIDGLELRYLARSLDGVDAGGDGFTLDVLPGRSYRGAFRPTDESWPRVFFSVSAAEVASGRLDIALPGAEGTRTVAGRVRFADYTPVKGARVVVLSASGDVLGSDTTDDERGRFAVVADARFESIDVRVEPPRDSSLFPEFRSSGLSSGDDLDLVAPLPPPGTTAFEAKLKVVTLAPGADEAGPFVALPGVPVTIVGVLSGGTIRLSTTTDSDGVARFLTFPGAYECLVSIPTELAAASWHGYISLTPPMGASVEETPMLRLGARPRARISITDHAGRPLEAGDVELERIPVRGDDDQLVIAPEPFFVAVDTNGTAEVAVDPGTYRVRVAPPAGSGAPMVRFDDVVVSREAASLDLTLPPPGLLHLTVSSPDGSWLPDVAVELFTPDPSGTPRLLGRGMTNANGFLDAVVPHVPGDAAP